MLDAIDLSTIERRIGNELGVSDWLLIDQPRIDAFAHCTGDAQWIHVNTERARREGPFGTTVAHGYLTLALLAPSAFDVYIQRTGASQAFNYGLDKVRFIAPVKSGSRVRTRIRLIDAQQRSDGRVLLATENTVEIEGSDKPALIAHALVMLAP